MDITLRIRKMRESKGYSQEYMAYKLGISQSAYCKIENDDKKVNFENIDRITEVLEVELMELVQ
jgi:transcriptional regulator with XRE-family HTH domain